MSSRPATLGQLRESGWVSRTVKEELRRNAIAKIRAGEPLFPRVLGYEDTVIPQLENALLAGHDIVFLGERGQAKTRLIRSLVNLLDEWMPIISGSEINDDPYHPVSKYARDLVAEHGEDTRVDWVHREDRFGEKLATPDTSIADLIGEVDPIKVAEGRYLSDELTLHYGIVPRTNRGIFAMNELPDLAERIQVGLLNVLEERDVQVRGYKIRLPLDLLLVCSANPEDYTNRGRIITPLKDRFGSQVRTHYPPDHRDRDRHRRPGGAPLRRRRACRAGAGLHDGGRLHDLPPGPRLRQRQPALRRVGAACRWRTTRRWSPTRRRRAIMFGENEVVPRVSDLEALAASTAGKVEIESLEEGRDGQIVENLIRSARADRVQVRGVARHLPGHPRRLRGRRGGQRRRGRALDRPRAPAQRGRGPAGPGAGR